MSIFLQFETQFDPYTTYCMEEANCLKYFKEKLAESEDFKTYITVRLFLVDVLENIPLKTISSVFAFH